VKNKDAIGQKTQLLKALETCEHLPEKTMKIEDGKMVPTSSGPND
jgi:hypothetical protein